MAWPTMVVSDGKDVDVIFPDTANYAKRKTLNDSLAKFASEGRACLRVNNNPFRCLLIRNWGQANLIDLFIRRPFLRLLQSVSTTRRSSGVRANCSASFPKPLLSTAGSCCSSFARA